MKQSSASARRGLPRLLRAGWSTLRAGIAREPVLAALVALLIALQVLHPSPWHTLPGLIDWQTLLTLAGLLTLTRAIGLSGLLDWLAQRLLAAVHTERALALSLVLMAAAISTLLTNDVALFAVLPLVLSINRIVPLPAARLVVFIALSVNAGSILTPLGNPQNLFLWQTSGVSFGSFVAALAPLAGALMVALCALGAACFSGRRLDLSATARSGPAAVDRRLAGIAAAAFVGFVVLADLRHAAPAFGLLALGCLLWRPRILLGIDWLLLCVFALMFIVLRSVAALPVVHQWLSQAGLADGMRVFFAGALLSQAISNVPAAIGLAQFTHDWRALAYGVSAGGFGLAIGSLANLIAIRLAPLPGIWRRLHLFSIPFLGVALVLGWGILRLMNR